jgi:hypothetical protein
MVHERVRLTLERRDAKAHRTDFSLPNRGWFGVVLEDVQHLNRLEVALGRDLFGATHEASLRRDPLVRRVEIGPGAVVAAGIEPLEEIDLRGPGAGCRQILVAAAGGAHEHEQDESAQPCHNETIFAARRGGPSQEGGLDETQLSRSAALLAPRRRPQSRP